MRPSPVAWTVLLVIVLTNYGAQVVLTFHRAHALHAALPNLHATLLMLATLALFLGAHVLLMRGRTAGVWLMAVYLSAVFLFYSVNWIGLQVHGYGLLYHLESPDLLLDVIYGIGYVNLFAAGYFLLRLFGKDWTVAK